MTNEKKVAEILEYILETECDPIVSCEKWPELLPEVRRRLEQVRRVEKQLDQLFPECKSNQQMAGFEEQAAPDRLPTVAGYDIEGILGSGGMGVVYKARHRKLNRVVALKMLRAGQLATPSELTRFAREFQAIAELDCSHIVQIHDVGDADGRPFFTMEFVQGGSLAERLLGAPQSAGESATMVATLAKAIHSAHDRGIVHRDLKPANILLSRDGCPKIADFGLARHIKCDHPLTISGAQLGTPSYMAPEQAIGSPESVGPAVDVYALGAILYEMLTGRPPFLAETPLETQRQLLHVDPVPPSRINASVPCDLETICLACLVKEPHRRYASANDLAADLERFLRHEPIHARSVGRWERLWRWIRRNPLVAGLMMSVIALVGLASTFALREYAAAEQLQFELEKWNQRLSFVHQLEQEGRFTEARAILGRVPDGGYSELQVQIAKAQTDLHFAERLDAIRMSRGKFVQGGGIDYEESSRRYAIEFRESRTGTFSDEPLQVAQRIKNSSVQVALVAALDDWAVCATAEDRRWILAVARSTDPDPWRDQVRDQDQWADLDHLQQLANCVDIQKQPVTLLVAMATRWRRLGGDPREYLRDVYHCHPGDFWLNFELALLYANDTPAFALAHNSAALAVRPNAASVHFNQGIAYQRLQLLEEASFHFSRTIELDPTHSWAEHHLAIALFDSGDTRNALKHFERALELDPTFRDARNALRIALVKSAMLEKAAIVWETTLLDPVATHDDLDGIAELLLYLNQEEKFHMVSQKMLDRFEQSSDPFLCERLGRTCLLKPRSDAIRNRATALIDRAVAANLADDQQWAKPFFLFAQALSDYRQNRFHVAVKQLEGDASTALQPCPDLLLAMAFQQIGEHAEAQKALSRAEKRLDPNLPALTREQWLIAILRREAVNLGLKSQ